MIEWLIYNRIETTVLQDKKCSISYIQRKYNLSYNNVMSYISKLIDNKIIDNNMKVL